MDEIVKKISSYNIFNYLFPGTLFAFIATNLTAYQFVQSDLFIAVFLYYFLGLIVSRVGSLVIEPALKATSYLKTSSYKDFIFASQKDEKIELLSEANNMYRTLLSLFLLLALTIGYSAVELAYPRLEEYRNFVVLALLILLFLVSYRKQTNYIRARVKASKN